MMTFGVLLPTYCGEEFGAGITLRELERWVHTAEKLGFTYFWHLDRLMARAPPAYNTSWYEPVTTLAAIMPFVRNARIGTAIVNSTYRNPTILAKQFATLDRLSNGKLTIGLGRGWNKAELQVSNVNFKETSRRFEESAGLIRKLLAEPTVTFKGEFWQLNDFRLEPRPVQTPSPPILIGGGGDGIHFKKPMATETGVQTVLERVARLGDGWIIRTNTTPVEITNSVKTLNAYLVRYGKNPETFMMAHQNFVFVLGKSGSEVEARQRFKKLSLRPYEMLTSSYVIGTPDVVSTMIRKEAEAGVKHFIIMPVGIDYETLQFFSDEILPTYS